MMKTSLLSVACAAVAGSLSLAACGGSDGAAPAAAAALSCDAQSLAAVKLDKATIDGVAAVAAGPYTPAGYPVSVGTLPAFCKITGTTTSTADSLVHFELWVPSAGWNGKFVATGNGGYSPSLSYGDMATALTRGYATVGGDTGHTSQDLLFVIGHPQKIVDWGTSSVHDITVAGKAIVAGMQAKPATRSYYMGCSTGGHQAYAEVQRYPADFDGVLAGAPGNNRVALNAEFMNRFLANHATGDNATPILTSAKVAMVTAAAVAACDAIDGVKDGVIGDPRACGKSQFNVDALLCTAGDAANCLTAPQLAAVKKIYAGAVNPRTQAVVYPGPVVGTEAGWASYWGTTEPTRADFWRYWVFDNPDWNWWAFDFDRHMTYAWAKAGPQVDQTNADIGAFKARGGKLITYQGWADPVVNPLDTIAYYDRVNSLQGTQAATDSFFRLFLAPGMGHCSGGSGPANFGNQGGPAPVVDAAHDLLTALDQWVEKGAAPESVIASKVANGTVTQTRPLCPHPRKAVYKGSGSTDDAANFSCS